VLFPTIDFAVFFVIVFTLNWLLRPYPTAWRLVMIAASIYFYAYWEPFYALLIMGSILFNWSVGRAAHRSLGPDGQKTARSRMWVIVAVVGNLGVFAYYKYLLFFVDGIVSIANAFPAGDIDPPLIEILLPVGISFFTFQALSYVIDAGRNDIDELPLIDFALYVSFFPQLVAGPIVRATEFAPQLHHRPDPRHLRYAEAFRLIFAGLFKKMVISGYLAAQIVDPVFANPELQSSPDILFAVYSYAIQIYADFSGYTDIAIGCALLLGFRFPQNFNSPYVARSLQDFWRRWHMTLSRWLRDYLYIPLGGNRGPEMFVYRNLFLTMLLGGLWHGAAWTFVVWGALHGVALIAERSDRLMLGLPVVALAATPVLLLVGWITGWGTGTWIGIGWAVAAIAVIAGASARLAPHESSSPGGVAVKVVRWAATFNVVCLTWVFFRAETVSDALSMLHRLFTAGGPATAVTWVVVAVIAASIASQFVPSRWVEQVQVVYSRAGLAIQAVAVVVGLLVVSAFGPEGVAPFIYFQF
jgi:D-alanyl-lipoteichoic acid acyltransferase DltB (MBOAT superfamily)